MKILIILSLIAPFIGGIFFTWSTIEDNGLWIYGTLTITTSFLTYIIHYFYAIYSLKKLVDVQKGIKTKNNNEYIFMNIHFHRETFTRKNFLEYKTHYKSFYRQVDIKIKYPFI